ncbi:branched-chain amino acid ABC transporter permease [Rhodospirillaceae bacterium SYSU D60014]|uniref:branched-chain amino acid ABC transporter permease n=1 Tax=Virgifigura deserti TaxID=2268457 RepID=UPI000E6694BA
MGDFTYLLISGLSLGSLYALMALGLVIVYGILRLVNFAYGEYIMVAGYTLFLLSPSPLPWLVMAVVAAVMAAVMSYLTERIAFRPVREKSLTAMLITSFAVSTLLQNAALLFVSPRARVVPTPGIFSETVIIAGNVTPVREILAIVVSVALLIGFSILLRKTILGIALRAAADKFTMTRMLGVPANLVISAAFVISGLLAGIVAIFWLGRTGSVTPGIGLTPLLVAFVSTVIGGMRSLSGAVVGGYVLAFVTIIFNNLLPGDLYEFREAFIFTIVILILLFRPEGLVRGRG